MCLDTITQKYKHPQRTIVQAYKVFYNSEGKFHHLFYRRFTASGSSLPMDTWIRALEQPVCVNTTKFYTSGFHAFEHKIKLVEEYRMYSDEVPFTTQKLVYLYGVHTKGIQISCTELPTLVARWLYVPSDPSAPAPAFPPRARAQKLLR